MNWMQRFYDINGNLIFDPFKYDINKIIVEEINGSLRFLDLNGKILFDTQNIKYYTINHELLYDGTKNSSNIVYNEKSQSFINNSNSKYNEKHEEISYDKSHIMNTQTNNKSQTNTYNDSNTTINIPPKVQPTIKEIDNNNTFNTPSTIQGIASENSSTHILSESIISSSNGSNTTKTTEEVINAISNISNKPVSNSGKLYYSSDWQLLVKEAGLDKNAVDSNTSFIAYYHGAGEEMSNALKTSFAKDNKNSICLASMHLTKSSEYFTGSNNIPDACGISQKNVVFAGASYGGKFVLPDFATSIMEHPDIKYRKCAIFEGMPTNEMTQKQIDAIKQNGALLFMVDSGIYDDGFLKNSKVELFNTPDSEARIFHIVTDFGNNSRIDYHTSCIESGLSSEFGLIDLLSGDETKFKEMMEKVKNGEKIAYIDQNGRSRLGSFTPKFELKYKGATIKLTIDEFYDYYCAINNIDKDSNISNKLNYINTIYNIEKRIPLPNGINTISDSVSIVENYMKQINDVINKLDDNTSFCNLNDPIGLNEIINQTIKSYNESISNFKLIMNKCTNTGLNISESHIKLDTELATNVNKI